MSEQLDVLSIGDIVTDAFVKLYDDQAKTYEDEKGAWLAMPFGMSLTTANIQCRKKSTCSFCRRSALLLIATYPSTAAAAPRAITLSMR